MTIEINDENFNKFIKSGNTLVDFWAPWCGPCRMLTPVIEELSEEMSDQIKIAKCNVDENKETPSKFDVMGIPALMIFKNGELVAKRSGMAPKKIIQDWILENI